MSYVLHIWEKPDTVPWPTSVEEAHQLLTRLDGVQSGQNQKFLALARKLTERFPCICSQEAEDIPESDWAWSDGPLDGKTDQAKYSIGLNSGMLDQVRPFVFRLANEFGLCVTDDQAGCVQLANGAMLSIALPATNTPKTAYDDVPKRRELEQIVFERLVPFMGKYGYKAIKSDRSFKQTFPNGWHEFSMDMVDQWPLQCKFDFGVTSRFHAVTNLECAIENPDRPLKDTKAMHTTVLGQRYWMAEVGGYVHGINKEYVVKSFSDIDPVMMHLFGQFETLMTILEKYKTIEGLDQLLNPQPVASSMFFSSYRNGSAHLIAAYLARNPRLEQLCDEFLAETANINSDPYLVDPMRRCIEYIRTHPVQ